LSLRQSRTGENGSGASKLAEEDPTFRTYTDQETGQTIIAGMESFTLK